MNDFADPIPGVMRPGTTRRWLEHSVKTWYIVTAVGQWFFVVYILGYFGGKFLSAGLPGFGETHLPNGYVEGDTAGNIAIAVHILIAGLIIAAGQIQLLPAIRRVVPRLHRYSGYFYILASVIVCVAGLYLTWARENVIGDLSTEIGTSLGGVLVLIFAPIALFYAIKRDFVTHRRWALRLFIAVSAVWFLRLMIFGWFMTTGGVGIDPETFTGPFLTVAYFAQTLLPLAVLELYFRAQESKSTAYRGAVASLIFVCTGLMAVGVFAVTWGFWIPRMGI